MPAPVGLTTDFVYTMSTDVEFEWDDDDIEHLARHGITRYEAEEVLDGPQLRRRGGTRAPDRFRVLGRTAAGRYLALVYQLKPRGLIRPFTGWDMDRYERDLYERQAQG
jgi:uncharacterized protein